jgi:hypothetical protein
MGDGVNLPDAAAIASRLQSLTEIESLDRAEAIAVEIRIGVHYGPVAHYVNARGIERPTGLAVFVAEDIASDEHARSRKGIILTRLSDHGTWLELARDQHLPLRQSQCLEKKPFDEPHVLGRMYDE